jgi:transposase
MSTSLLYHGFGVKGCHYVRTRYVDGQMIFTLRQNPEMLRCPACGSSDVVCRGQVVRRFRTVPIGHKPVFLELPLQRVACRACGIVRQVRLAFADARRCYTKAFERYALELSRKMTIQDVAQHLGVSWDVVKDILKRYLKRHFERPRLRDLRWIAIDEIAIGKGQRYLTVVLDLLSGAVVFVGSGKGAEALAPFWRRLRHSGARIKAAAIDMSPAYIAALQSNLPQAVIVFDHFHIVKQYNEMLSNFRRWLYHKVEDESQRQVLKGSRWLLLKNPEHLDESRNESARLAEALALNQPLALAYYLKEDLRQLWSQVDKREAARFLDDWCRRADVSGIRMLKRFAQMLVRHRDGILAYYDFYISTGPLEGTNNKIRTMQRQAYGYRDQEFLRLKIYTLHTLKYALVG